MASRAGVRSGPPSIAALGQRAHRLLESRRLPLLAATLAALLTSPSLWGGLATEDWLQKGLVEGGGFSLLGRVNLFGHGHRLSASEMSRRFLEFRIAGFWPWLTNEALDVSFFRPLASLTHLVDYRFWPNHPAWMHAESIAWYAALVFAVAVLYRRLDGPAWLSGAAALLYAADDAHGHAVGWLINRNALMAGVFGVLALIAWDRFRRAGKKTGAILTPLLLALCLGSAEYGVSVAGYFLAYTLILDRSPVRTRWAFATIWMVVLGGWAILYRATGHAVRGSGLYVDPIVAPGEWAADLLERAVVLFMGQYGTPFSDLWSRSTPYVQGFVTLWAVAFLWLTSWMVWPLLRHDRAARFWALGSVLSIPPACSTFCEDRLLFFAGIGAMAVIATFVRSAWTTRGSKDSRGVLGLAFAAFWVALHAGLAPLLLPVRSLYMARYDARLATARTTAFAGAARSSTVVLVNGEDFYFTGMLSQTRLSRREPVPARLLALAGTPDDLILRRVDEQTLEVRPQGGFFSRVFNRIYRSAARPLHRGEHIDFVGIDVTVADTSAAREPTVAVFRFPTSLDSPEYRFRAWDQESARYDAFTPPAVGQSVTLRARP